MSLQMHVMTPEEQAVHHAAVLADNEAKERARVARENRAKGFSEPKPGDRLYVSSGRGIRMRSRAGISFNEMERTEVHVYAEGDDPPAGVKSVTTHGAELILADLSLNVMGRNATDAEAADLRRQLADRDSENARLKAENARLLREARMGAKDAGDGSPQRLLAQRKAKAGLADPEGFGGKD